jgi:hypothetical protein
MTFKNVSPETLNIHELERLLRNAEAATREAWAKWDGKSDAEHRAFNRANAEEESLRWRLDAVRKGG